MKRNNNILFAFLVISLIAGIVSCAKKKAPDTVTTKLLGKWRLTKIAPGDNTGLNPLVYSALPKEEVWYWTFNENGTGYDVENWNNQEGIQDNFSYKVYSGDSLWRGTQAHDTANYFISVINSDYMIWTKTFVNDSGIRITEGFFFNKD